MRFDQVAFLARSWRRLAIIGLISGWVGTLQAADLASELKASGWQVEKTADGSLILHPPAATRPERTTSTTASASPMDRLAEALAQKGWQVAREADGSLILHPGETAGTTAKTNDTGAAVDEQSLQRLRDAGWKVQRDAEGNLRLYPPTGAAEHPPTATPPASPPQALDEAMKAQLRKAGWTIEENTDGALWLYPPKVAADVHPCPGEAPALSVELPVDSWSKAHRLAAAWVEKHQRSDITVGRIRKILRIYLVSLVTRSAPHRLVHQIAIRTEDGHLILLD